MAGVGPIFSSVCFVKCNVTVPEDWTNLWDSAEKVLGGKVDILLNNAGINPTVFEKIFTTYIE